MAMLSVDRWRWRERERMGVGEGRGEERRGEEDG